MDHGIEVEPESRGSRPESERSSGVWRFFNQRSPRAEIVFGCQILLLYTVAAVALYNLTRKCGEDKFWVGLLCSIIGYCLPNPKISLPK